MSRGSFLLNSTPLLNSTASRFQDIFRRNASPALLLLSLVALLPASSAHAQSAGGWNKRGQAAEIREDYDAAYEAYRQAHLKSPKDLRYLAHLDRMRFLAATQHVDRGRTLRQSGDYAGAITNFMRAAEIDPSNQAAQQEIERTQREQPPPGLTGPAAVAAMEQMSQQRATLDSINSIAAPIELKPVSSDPITFHAVEDVKNIYQAIGKLAGLNVLFDPEYVSKRIPVDLTNVSVSEALRIVGTIAGTFYKPVTINTIFVAQNSRQRHTDLDELAVQTFYLSNSSQPNDANEILTGLRLLLDPSIKLYLVPSQNAIVMRATTDQLLLAQKLINDFDRARPEVVVDVAVLEVNRDKVRKLGITLPTSVSLTPQLATTSTTSTTSTTTPNPSANLTLNNLAHLNANNFAVSISGGTLDALLSDVDTRVLQNPRIRATDGQRATLKIGQKIPIATGSFGGGGGIGGAASAIGGYGVQTQFTYVDVGVNIDITPTVHYDREVTLKTSIEVSQQNGSVLVSPGVTQPIFAQRKLDQVIQLRDGEPSILAGIVTKQDNKSVQGTPGLGELPFFKFFFSSQNKEVQTDEIVFLLIPHIVRESVLTRVNMAAIDTGTGGNIELRHDDTQRPRLASEQPPTIIPGVPPSSPPTTAAAAASAAIAQMNQGAQPSAPPFASAASGLASAIPPPSTAPWPAGTLKLSVVAPPTPQAVGSTFQVTVLLQNGHNVFSVPVQLQYDARVLQLVNVDAGDFLTRDGKPVAIVHRDEGNGLTTISTSRPPSTNGMSGQGSLCTLTFKAAAAGTSPITLVKMGAKDALQQSIPAAPGDGAVVHVQ